MIDMLEQLSNAVGLIARSDVKRVADEINRRVMDLLGASLVKLYWLQEAEDGIILAPFTFINETSNPDPRAFQLSSKDPVGSVLAWVFTTGRPIWFESLASKDTRLSPTLRWPPSRPPSRSTARTRSTCRSSTRPSGKA